MKLLHLAIFRRPVSAYQTSSHHRNPAIIPPIAPIPSSTTSPQAKKVHVLFSLWRTPGQKQLHCCRRLHSSNVSYQWLNGSMAPSYSSCSAQRDAIPILINLPSSSQGGTKERWWPDRDLRAVFHFSLSLTLPSCHDHFFELSFLSSCSSTFTVRPDCALMSRWCSGVFAG